MSIVQSIYRSIGRHATILALVIVVAISAPASAANLIWDNGGSGSDWATAGNWQLAPGGTDQAPVGGDTLYFTSTSNTGWGGNNNLAVGTAINGINFGVVPTGGTGNTSVGGHSIGGNRILLTGNLLNDSSNNTGVQRINFDIELSGFRQFQAMANNSLSNGSATEDFVFGGTFTGSGSMFLRGDGNGKYRFNGALNQDGNFGMTDSNTQATFNAVNSYTGTTTVARGTLFTLVDGALPSTTTVQMGQGFSNANASTLDLSGTNQTIAGLFHEASANNNQNHRIVSTAPATLTINNTSNYVYGDATHDGEIGGAISLVKGGSGTQTLGDTNTYTGSTTINAGTLELLATGSIDNSSSIEIGAGGTFDVSAISNYTMDGTQPFTFGIDATDGGDAGLIDAAGLDITAAIVGFDITGELDDSDYILANYTALTGASFADVTVPDGYELDYNYQGGNQIALTQLAVPEPSTIILALFGLIAMGVTYRRRK